MVAVTVAAVAAAATGVGDVACCGGGVEARPRCADRERRDEADEDDEDEVDEVEEAGEAAEAR